MNSCHLEKARGHFVSKPLFVTIPHSGEWIPESATWLKGRDPLLLLSDVDRFVDRLYHPALETHGIPKVVALCHRYVVDLNRLPEDVDQESVQGAIAKPGTHTTGFHWVRTMKGETLMAAPIPLALHQNLVAEHFVPFHEQVRSLYVEQHRRNSGPVYHLDLHSMPSLGTSGHRDEGQMRAEVVISDQDGRSCLADFTALVVEAFEKIGGFQVALNWPYKGGRITQTYGAPEINNNCLQVELNRKIYMSETSKEWREDSAPQVQQRLTKVLGYILAKI